MLSSKLVYLNGMPIGRAATWFDVAVIVNSATGLSYSAKTMQERASEGPRGFYVTLRLDVISE